MAKFQLNTAMVIYALLFVGVVVGIGYVAMNLPGNAYEGFEEEPQPEENNEEEEGEEEAEAEEEAEEGEENAEGFANMEMGQSDAAVVRMNQNAAPIATSTGAAGVSAYDGETQFASLGGEEGMAQVAQPNNPANCFPRDSLNPGELLPKEKSDYAAFQPMGQGNLAGRNFLEAGKLIGIDTVGQSLRNANYQLRSEPANPRVAVSVFNNSTIAPDITRRHLEIGSGH